MTYTYYIFYLVINKVLTFIAKLLSLFFTIGKSSSSTSNKRDYRKYLGIVLAKAHSIVAGFWVYNLYSLMALKD